MKKIIFTLLFITVFLPLKETFAMRNISILQPAIQQEDITGVDLHSYTINGNSTTLQRIATVSFTVHNHAINNERIDWCIQSDEFEAYNLFKRIVIKDENNTILVDKNNLEDENTWHNLGNGKYKLRFNYGDFNGDIVSPGERVTYTFYVEVQGNPVTIAQQKVNIRKTDNQGEIGYIDFPWKNFSIIHQYAFPLFFLKNESK